MLSLILRSLILGATAFGVATLVPKANLDRRTKIILAISVIAICIILDFGAYILGKLKGAICRCEDAAQSALETEALRQRVAALTSATAPVATQPVQAPANMPATIQSAMQHPSVDPDIDEAIRALSQ